MNINEITLNNVGPIEKATIKINNDINIIIGEQASGKSTLAKEIYFFKKIRDYFFEFLCTPSNFVYDSLEELYLYFLKYIRSDYMESFGTTKHLPKQYSLKYSYGEDHDVLVTLDKKNYARFRFSLAMEKRLKETMQTVMKIYSSVNEAIDDPYNSFITRQRLREEIADHFKNIVEDIFFEEGDIVYIPAGRSMLSVLSEQQDVINVKGLDLPMRDFVKKIRELKPRFNKKLDELVTDYVKTVKGQIKNRDVDLALSVVEKILRGKYVSDNDGEKLFIDEDHWVKLIYSSSGQQEVLWILNMLFISILEHKKTFFIIEEPEAHLFPQSQRYVMELISLTHNSNGSQMLITTHSPYILTSTNLLIYSGMVEGKQNNGSSYVIEKKIRLSEGIVKAYRFRINRSELVDIMDDEGLLINTSEIDEASDLINEDTDKILRMEVDNDM